MKKIIFLVIIFSSCKKEEKPPFNVEKSVDLVNSGGNSFNFDGYKVSSDARKLGKDYWLNVPILTDIITYSFAKNIDSRLSWLNFTTQQIAGDFNNDGWIDVFNPGTGKYNNKVIDNYSWFIWNPSTKTYDIRDLFTNLTKPYFGQNQYKSIPTYLNNDNYVDIVIFDSYDEVSHDVPFYEPIRIVMSNGNGGYELIDCPIAIGKYHHSGDVGDIDGDGIDDIVICTGSEVILGKGSKTLPYFNQWKTIDSTVTSNQAYYANIRDVNKDNLIDLVLGCSDINESSKNRVLLNQGNSEFNNKGLKILPDANSISNKGLNLDYKYDDLNNDGNLDIIAVTAGIDYKTWSINTYLQNNDNSFKIDTSYIKYTSNTNRYSTTNTTNWKSRLIYEDFNGDGIKDITYIDAHNFLHTLKDKTIFIKRGGGFVEDDIYKYDKFLNYIKKN
jgi:hypothetical protein